MPQLIEVPATVRKRLLGLRPALLSDALGKTGAMAGVLGAFFDSFRAGAFAALTGAFFAGAFAASRAGAFVASTAWL